MKNVSKYKWYWAWLIQATVPIEGQDSLHARCEVWKNLVIVRADSPNRAIAKAYKIGESEAGDARGTLRLNGRPAITKFLGIASIGLVHDGLSDGAEIVWEMRRCRRSTAESLVVPNSDLLTILRSELRSS